MTTQEKFNAGIIGLGVMGAALARNLVGKGVALAAFSREGEVRERFRLAAFSREADERERFRVSGSADAGCLSDSTGSGCLSDSADAGCFEVFDALEAFVASLAVPRRIMLMITAGPPVDQVLDSLLPLLDPGDVVMDCGNSWYRDTMRRGARLNALGLHYMGVGVSGGEQGALEGPSVMAGGDPEGWHICADLLRACAAEADGVPCCGYLGTDGAGHYVKMVHNGIEYGVLELIAEACLLMGRLKGWSDTEIADCFSHWRSGKLASYLIDATTVVLSKRDEDGALLVDQILDVAGQNGTGKWTALEGIERGVYIPTISEALAMRSHSERLELRHRGQAELHITPVSMEFCGDPYRVTAIKRRLDDRELPSLEEKDMEDALYAAILFCYSQGFELLAAASQHFLWNIPLNEVANVWKAGCIIRAELLYSIEKALDSAYQGNLLLSEEFHPLKEEAALRRLSAAAAAAGISAPAFSASLNYYDACRAGQMPVNLIQGLRDHFGAHKFRRVDREGLFHEKWD
ncbi:MAG: NADP-dependent phosphogluconate dehydrogenase [Peptococcaceae bacterium]|jgi:6-phosphogluconate dehydrogenase|nr:NADP-dependent phosphogluconate dehydrogenase [Peptococcaceae bacterium]